MSSNGKKLAANGTYFTLLVLNLQHCEKDDKSRELNLTNISPLVASLLLNHTNLFNQEVKRFREVSKMKGSPPRCQ